MSENIHLSDLWEHTITKIFKLDPKYKVDHMIRQWVIYSKLEDFNSLLNNTDEDFKPDGGGNLSYYKENGDSVVKMMSTTPLQMLENLRWYIQYLIHESGYLYDDDESNYPLSEDKWMLQTHGKFMKYVLFTLHRMTPEQMKMNPIKPIIKVKTNEELDTEEGESNTDEQESTISNKEVAEYSTFSDMSKQDSESDINVDDTQDEQNPHTPETLQIHNIYNTTMHDKDDLIHDEYDTSEDENITEIETYEEYGEKIHETEESKSIETSQVHYVLNKSIPNEVDSYTVKDVTEIDLPEENGEQNNAKEDKLLTTNFEVKVENQKVERLITYSTDQQIFKFKVISGTDQEVWGVYIHSQSNQNKWTIHGILLHMGFYVTTENPNLMIRENHNTQSFEYYYMSKWIVYCINYT